MENMQKLLYEMQVDFVCASNLQGQTHQVGRISRNYSTFSSPEAALLFGQHQVSPPLARSNDILVLNGFINTLDWDQNQSDLPDLTLSMCIVTGSPWITDFWSWTWPEVAILGAD